MFTSGSTGIPKGVNLTHSNLIATLKAFTDAIYLDNNDVFMGYLPLAHVFELLGGNYEIFYKVIKYSLELFFYFISYTTM